MSRTDLPSSAQPRRLEDAPQAVSSNQAVAIEGETHLAPRGVRSDERCNTAAGISQPISRSISMRAETEGSSDDVVNRMSDALHAWTNMMDLTASVGDFVLRKKIELTRARHAKRNHSSTEISQDNKRIRTVSPSASRSLLAPLSATDVSNTEDRLTRIDVDLHSNGSTEQQLGADLASDIDRVRRLAHLLVRIKTANSCFQEEIFAVLREAHEGPKDGDQFQRSEAE